MPESYPRSHTPEWIVNGDCPHLCFYSNEGSEPPHIHVAFGDGLAKFWLGPVALVGSRGISPRDLLRLQRFV